MAVYNSSFTIVYVSKTGAKERANQDFITKLECALIVHMSSYFKSIDWCKTIYQKTPHSDCWEMKFIMIVLTKKNTTKLTEKQKSIKFFYVLYSIFVSWIGVVPIKNH